MQDQDYILFENYLSGTLSKEETIAFENRLKTDFKCNESFNTYKEVSGFLEHTFENEVASTAFKNNLKSISTTYFEKQKTPKNTSRFKPWQYAMAASVALLLGIVLFNNFSTPNYANFATHETISLTVRGEQDALLKTAENAFNTKDFAKAEDAFKSLILMDNNNAEIQFYSGIANIELNNFEAAESLLTHLSKGKTAYKNNAIWYLALSKLKQKEYIDCLEILKTIPEDANTYNKAQKLIKKLK